MSLLSDAVLPIPLPSLVEAVAKPEEILAQPDVDEKNGMCGFMP